MWTRPSQTLLTDVIRQAQTSLILCSPFISRWGLEQIQQNLQGSVKEVEVWTKLDSYDWLAGASNPEALLEFADRTEARVQNFRLRVSNALHAKFFLADQERALAGSANLTQGGFAGNIEIVRIVEGGEMPQFLTYVQDVRQILTLTTLEELRTFVTACNNRAADREALLDLTREVVPTMPDIGRSLVPLSDFITYVRRIGGSVADEIVKIHYNLDGNNRTGHLKQAYYAVQRLFQEHPQAIQQVISLTDVNHPFELQATPLLADWLRFIRSFATESNAQYEYDLAVLRGYLTPQFGGVRVGGGGGDYPFKLVWPHLARRLQPV